MGDFPESNGGRAAAVSPPFTSPANSSALEIGRERWVRAEKAAEKIICDVQPTSVSEQRRRDIIDYVQRLIGNSLGVERIAQFDRQVCMPAWSDESVYISLVR
ncbi:Hypothetical predicted protein [Olea europaea subsp. europaea]|uniref:Uncharacterized protein n=1 Tax=Olea europaea subsp. europaea TaxID=158383 RepID=A0A8S0R4R0_OLEEU|nr:Hypothetical predicted protein [Olea europaea subsp. europaea]